MKHRKAKKTVGMPPVETEKSPAKRKTLWAAWDRLSPAELWASDRNRNRFSPPAFG